MTDNVAILEGYTEEVWACYNGESYSLLVKPGTDLDSRFKAWDMEAQTFGMVSGYNADDINFC